MEACANGEVMTEFAALQEHMKNIDKNTECLPKMCEMVTRHDERIAAHSQQLKTLSSRWWALVVILLGDALSVIAALLYHR